MGAPGRRWLVRREAGLARRRRRHPRTDRDVGRGATRRGRDDEHPDREPAPAVRDVLPARRCADRHPHRRPDLPVRPIRRRVAAPAPRPGPGARPHRRPAARRGGAAPGRGPRGGHPRAPRSPGGGAPGRRRTTPRARRTTSSGSPRRSTQQAPSPCGTWRTPSGNLPLALARCGRRRRGVVHVQVPQRRPGVDRPGVRPRAPRDRRRPAADRLVGQRPGDALSDGRDVRAGARRRRLADLDAAHPVAGPHPRVARDLRRGRHRCLCAGSRSS